MKSISWDERYPVRRNGRRFRWRSALNTFWYLLGNWLATESIADPERVESMAFLPRSHSQSDLRAQEDVVDRKQDEYRSRAGKSGGGLLKSLWNRVRGREPEPDYRPIQADHEIENGHGQEHEEWYMMLKSLADWFRMHIDVKLSTTSMACIIYSFSPYHTSDWGIAVKRRTKKTRILFRQ